MDFRSKYGPWALVAGATEGIGRAFSEQLAERGFSLVLAARRQALLDEVAAGLRQKHGIDVRTVAVDLGVPDVVARVRSVTDGLEVGLVVYNAAVSVTGPFFATDLEQRMQEIDVNCRGPLRFVHHFGKAMAERKRGGLVLMSSLSGKQGTAFVTSYAATKAFNSVLAEGLWAELQQHGIDVLACEAGATATPNYLGSLDKGGQGGVRAMEPGDVARAALSALGRRPTVIPGLFNRFAAASLSLMGRTQAIRVISATTRRMYGGA